MPTPSENPDSRPQETKNGAAKELTDEKKAGMLRVGYGARLDPVFLDKKALTRGLVVVGQSGCGKTYFLGRLIEEMMIKGENRDRLLVIDSNSDFCKGLQTVKADKLKKMLRELLKSTSPSGRNRRKAEEHEDSRLGKVGEAISAVRVFGTAEKPFDLAWKSLMDNPRTLYKYLAKASGRPDEYLCCLLWAYHNFDREKAYTEPLLKAFAEWFWRSAQDQWFSRSGVVDRAVEIAVSMDLKELAESREWRQDGETKGLPGELDHSARRLNILEIEGLKEDPARLRVTLATLDHLWKTQDTAREKRVADIAAGRKPKKEPRWFVFVDEAHRLAPAQTPSRLHELVAERLRQIASEGRKYAIHLVLATQRPTKVAPGLLGEFDNAVVMKMNSRADLEFLADQMRILDVKLLEQTLYFRGKGNAFAIGEAAGAAPNVVQFLTAPRVSIEGGKDLE